jgi:hypothetical protein
MGAGRPTKADPVTLYAFAHQFYWDFRRLTEGRSRDWLDRKKHQQLVGAIANLRLNNEQETRYQQTVDEEIRAGRLSEDERAAGLRDLKDGGLFVTRAWAENIAVEESTRTVKVPGESDVLERLLSVKTPEAVRKICRDAPNWPISSGSVLPTHLQEHAKEFIAARKDPRFPRSLRRPTSQLKQIWFLSRALAGAVFGVKTRTAINLVGSMRPEQVFHESRDGKPARKQRKSKHKS